MYDTSFIQWLNVTLHLKMCLLLLFLLLIMFVFMIRVKPTLILTLILIRMYNKMKKVRKRLYDIKLKALI